MSSLEVARSWAAVTVGAGKIGGTVGLGPVLLPERSPIKTAAVVTDDVSGQNICAKSCWRSKLVS